MGESRGSWYLLTGLLIGLALGLVYAWVINPVAYTNTDPASLSGNYKEAYRSLIAAAYGADGNLERARARLGLLKDSRPAEILAAQAQSVLANGGPSEDARRLALLAAALGKTPSPASPIPSITTTSSALPATLTPSATLQTVPSSTPNATKAVSTMTSTPRPSATFTPSPTFVTATPLPTVPSRTPTPTLGAPFMLKERQPVCDPDLPEALLQVQVTDAAGNGLPAIEIQVTWQGGADSFFTGLKPEIGPGYADFVMNPGEIYVVRLTAGSQAASNLVAPDCGTPGGANYWGGWLLVFTQ